MPKLRLYNLILIVFIPLLLYIVYKTRSTVKEEMKILKKNKLFDVFNFNYLLWFIRMILIYSLPHSSIKVNYRMVLLCLCYVFLKKRLLPNNLFDNLSLHIIWPYLKGLEKEVFSFDE